MADIDLHSSSSSSEESDDSHVSYSYSDDEEYYERPRDEFAMGLLPYQFEPVAFSTSSKDIAKKANVIPKDVRNRVDLGQWSAKDAMAPEQPQTSQEEKHSQNSKSFSDLPDSILLEIFKYVPVAVRCVASRVCCRWEKVLADHSLWKDCHFSYYSGRGSNYTTDALIQTGLNKSLQCLTVLTTHRHDSLKFGDKYIWENFPNLKSMYLLENEEMIGPNDIETLPVTLEHLEICHAWCLLPEPRLTIFDQSQEKQSAKVYLPNLQALAIGSEPEEIHEGAERAGKSLMLLDQLLNCPKLEMLSLNKAGLTRTQWKRLSCFVSNLKSLHIVIEEADELDEDFPFKYVLSPLRLPKLEQLFIGFESFSSHLLSSFLNSVINLPTIETLQLGRMWELKKQHLEKIVNSLPKLRKLEVSRSRYIQSSTIEELTRMREGLTCSFW